MTDLLVNSTAPRPVDYLDSRLRAADPEGVSSPGDYDSAFSGDAAIHAGIVSVEDAVEGVPLGIVRLYAEIASRHAIVREVDPGVWLATVVGLEGAWGDGDDAQEALDEMKEAIVGWVAVKRRVGAGDIPLMEGIDLNRRS